MIYGLIFLRHPVLTSQEQRDGIINYAKLHGLQIDKFISYNERPDITLFHAGDSIVLLAWNCICAKRSVLNTLVKYFLKNNIKLYSATSGYCIDNTVDFGAFEYAFNLYEDIRFNFLSAKSTAGVRVRVANGYAPGRHLGSKNKRHVTDGKETEILNMYSAGHSMYAIAKKLKVSAPTIKRFLSTQN